MEGRLGILVVGAALAGMALPATASASTFSVDGAFASPCDASHQCRTIGDAVTAAGAGDTIDVHAGTYPEAVTVPAGKDGLTISGAGSSQTKVTGGADAFTFAANGVTLANLAVDVPGGGGRAVNVTGNGASLSSLLLQRVNATGVDVPVVEVAGTGAGATTISKSVVIQQAGPDAALGVLVKGASGLVLTDSSVISAKGPALRITASTANQVVRSTLGAFAPSSNGLEIASSSADSTAKRLAIDSSIVSGGANAAGIGASSEAGTLGSTAGPIELSAVHLTTAGNAAGIALDAQANGVAATTGPTGAITANVKHSIVHGPSRANRFVGNGLQAASSATLTFASSDTPPPSPGTGTVNRAGDNTDTPDGQLFVSPGDRNFHLRASAPVIDTVSPPEGGESDRDVDGGARVVTGNAFANRNLADKGADEFTNSPPAATLTSSNTTARERVGVPFDASGSTDPESGLGGGVVAYYFSYGDGTSEAGGSPQALHAYGAKGIYGATASVIDAQGGLSSPSNVVPVFITDGTGPIAAIDSPKSGARIKAGKAINVAGVAADETGLQSVDVSVRYAGTTKKKAKAKHHKKRKKGKKGKKKKARRAAARIATCQYVTPTAKLVRGSCSSATYYPTTLRDTNWTFPLRRRNRLPKGTYEIRVRAIDLAGNATDAPSAGARTLVLFKII